MLVVNVSWCAGGSCACVAPPTHCRRQFSVLSCEARVPEAMRALRGGRVRSVREFLASHLSTKDYLRVRSASTPFAACRCHCAHVLPCHRALQAIGVADVKVKSGSKAARRRKAGRRQRGGAGAASSDAGAGAGAGAGARGSTNTGRAAPRVVTTMRLVRAGTRCSLAPLRVRV